MIYVVRLAFWRACNIIFKNTCVFPFLFLTADLAQNIQRRATCTIVTTVKSMCKCWGRVVDEIWKLTFSMFICTVHVVRSLNCQYQHMHNFNVTS